MYNNYLLTYNNYLLTYNNYLLKDIQEDKNNKMVEDIFFQEHPLRKDVGKLVWKIDKSFFSLIFLVINI